ncbi:hypothetical protein F7D01_10600 [Erythrobacter sp. 3-20A1M]|uniref:hypothetical protein n=1 Tax=Erythrobacter sp. 3-20A1M TaxID=2653850 RepID=UPI001BFBFC58|nr:hypothetical protein [Erythrobacter sp. 3-20A1M]QWC57471.1 hypothetical protein F7D01_10600 [Erythrobacter sp. 3-20A1M]
MKRTAFACLGALAVSACGSQVNCDDPDVLAKVDNRFLQTDSIVTLSRDESTGNLKCHGKIVGALAYDGLDYTVMRTASGELVVETQMTGRIM